MKKQTLGLITIVILGLGIIAGFFLLKNSNFSLRPQAKEKKRCVGTGYDIGADGGCYLLGGMECKISDNEWGCCNKKVADKYCQPLITIIVGNPKDYELKNGELKLKKKCKGSGYGIGSDGKCYLLQGAVCKNNNVKPPEEFCCNKEVDMSYCQKTKNK